MKNNRLLHAAVIAALGFTLPGCAVLFSSRNQKVNIRTATPGATIYFNGDSIGTGSARVKLNKYKVYNTFTAGKEGYRALNHTVTLHGYSPAIALTVVDVALVAYPFVRYRDDLGGTTQVFGGFGLAWVLLTDLKHAKTHRYRRSETIPALEPYQKRLNDEKFLLVNNIKVDIKASNQQFVTYSRLNKFEDANAKAKKGKSYAKDDITVDNTKFTRSLNYTLKKMLFIDTTNTIFPNVNNSLYINATISRITFHEVKSPYGSNNDHRAQPNHLFAVELGVDWDILDFYKQKITTIRTVEKSDLFTIAYGADKDDISNVVYEALKDNMEVSIMNLRKQLSAKKLLKFTEIKEEVSTIEITRPQQMERKKDDFKTSCVAVKADELSGSGAIISEDGYIITNFHLVAGAKKISIVLHDGTSTEAELVRKNATADMALLKVKKSGLTPFALSEENDPEIGGDVWAVGVVRSEDSVASLAHGIISGVRKTNGLVMLQTDASLNTGNSGSALVNDKGVAIGIVSLKVMGHGVDGLGFALSAHDVIEKLGLKYK